MPLKLKYISYKYREKSPETHLLSLLDWFYHTSLVHTEIWQPPTDVYETRSSLKIKIDLAGVEKEDIRITIFDDFLVVEGSREESLSQDKMAYHQMGIRYGPFRSEIFIPVPIDREGVTAEYENGILSVTLPKI